MHEPLSHRLSRILEAEPATAGLSVNDLIERTEGRGFYLVVILLSLPFVIPISLWGVSTVLGLSICLLCLRQGLGLPPRLPRVLGDRPLPPWVRQRILGGSVKVLRLVEKLAKPRRTRWMGTRAARSGNAFLLAFMAGLLALPFPPLPPLTNSLPCYALILIAASMMEEDGILIWAGYAVAFGTVLYLAVIAAVLQQALMKVYDWVASLLTQ